MGKSAASFLATTSVSCFQVHYRNICTTDKKCHVRKRQNGNGNLMTLVFAFCNRHSYYVSSSYEKNKEVLQLTVFII